MPPDFAAAFRSGLASGGLPAGITAVAPAEAAQRFAVYRNNVAHGLARALAARYPVIERLVGTSYFAALAAAYLQKDPPRSPVLIRWGAGFPRFLRHFPPLAALPYLADVARVEWMRGLAHHAAEAPPPTAAALARVAAAAGAARLALHPSVQVLRSPHAVVTIWQANQPGGAAPEIADRPEIALVLRDPAGAVPVLALSGGDADFLATLGRGESLMTAAMTARLTEPEHDPGAALRLLLRHGALTEG